nr:hypothetical protein Iba_chr12fCG22400 [Ipomoea batatas]
MQEVVDEGIRGCPSDGVEDGGDVPRCGGLRRPGLEGIIDEQVGFDLVEDVAEAWAGHSECLAEWENEVAREIFCGVTAWRKKLREISGGVQVDFHRRGQGDHEPAMATLEDENDQALKLRSHLFPGLLRHHALYRFAYVFCVKPAVFIPQDLRGDAQLHRHPGGDELLGVHGDVVDVLPLDIPASVDQTDFGGYLQGPWDGGSVNGVYVFGAFTQILELVWLHADGREREAVTRDIFCGVAAGRKKLREIAGGVQVDFHRMDFIRVKRRRGFSRRDDNRGRTQIDVEVAVVELIGKFHVGDKVAVSQPWQHYNTKTTIRHCYIEASVSPTIRPGLQQSYFVWYGDNVPNLVELSTLFIDDSLR